MRKGFNILFRSSNKEDFILERLGRLTGIEKINQVDSPQMMKKAIVPFIRTPDRRVYQMNCYSFDMLIDYDLLVKFIGDDDFQFDMKELQEFYKDSGIDVYFIEPNQEHYLILSHLNTGAAWSITSKNEEFFAFIAEIFEPRDVWEDVFVSEPKQLYYHKIECICEQLEGVMAKAEPAELARCYVRK